MKSNEIIFEQAIRETLEEYFKKSKAKKKDISVLLNWTLRDLNNFLHKNKSLKKSDQQCIFEIMGHFFKKEVQKKVDLLSCKKITTKTIKNFNPSDFTPDERKTMARLLNILRSQRQNDKKIVITLIDTIYHMNRKLRLSNPKE